MATLNIRDENKVITHNHEISQFLEQFGIWYRRFEKEDNLSENPSDEEILAYYAEPIEKLKKEGGYNTADVINIIPSTPNIDMMLNKFNKEHWHDEDEVRFIVKGRGLFHIHPESGPVFSIEIEAGDMINVPKGTYHWFDLCSDRNIRAIRLFQNTSGWTPHYTESNVDKNYQPLCMGPTYFPATEKKFGLEVDNAS